MKASDTLIIERVADAKADEVAGRYQPDLARWAVTSTKGGKGPDHNKTIFVRSGR